jgi:hypothetical protein
MASLRAVSTSSCVYLAYIPGSAAGERINPGIPAMITILLEIGLQNVGFGKVRNPKTYKDLISLWWCFTPRLVFRKGVEGLLGGFALQIFLEAKNGLAHD